MPRHTLQQPIRSSVAPTDERESAAQYRVYFFGPFRAFRGSKPIGEPRWRRNKAKSLLKWFILNPGKLFSADQLIELFWPNASPEEAALRNFYVTVHYLRHLLEPDLTHRQESTFIRRNANNFYWFEMDSFWWIDTMNVQLLMNQAREAEKSGDKVRAAFCYRKVVEHCRQGFLLEDTYEECFHPYRRQYDLLFSQVLTRLIQIYLERNEFDEVLDYAYQALQVDPFCEQAVQALAQAYCQRGDVCRALRLLNEFQDALKKEMGIDPSNELYQLRELIACRRLK